MSPKASWYFPVILVCLLLWPLPAAGQGIGGAVSGVVKDESGAVVEAATVRLINADTLATRLQSTDATGHFELRELPPGVYDIEVTKGGYTPTRVESVPIRVAIDSRLADIILKSGAVVPPTPGPLKVTPNVQQPQVALTEIGSPTLSTAFDTQQLQELPVLTRDINNLALLAPGVFSVRTFSFASTLVPFAANGSRGRDNNFIIDSVDNNEPLFGGAATQFTNTDLFAEYRILTNQYKAEYGRNSGSVVNIITKRGGNQFHGTFFFFGQSDRFNASNRVEQSAGLSGTTLDYETQIGGTLGGPIKKEKAWFFTSYQWDRARDDLSPLFPVVATLPTTAGFSALSALPSTPTLAALLSVPTVKIVPAATSPCGRPGSSLPALNPCTVSDPLNPVTVNGTAIPFGTFLVQRAGVFDVRDHQLSGRYDQRLGSRDDIYFRYLFDDLRTPQAPPSSAGDVAFGDFGLLPEARVIIRQRTQSLGMFWTRSWATALHELRGSFTRISSGTGPFTESAAVREHQPAVTILDNFAPLPGSGGTADATARLFNAFSAAGNTLSLGRDTRPTNVNSNLFQLQDNFSWSRGRNSFKVGANFVRTQSNIRQIPDDLGQYFYLSLQDFANNVPFFGWQRFPNFQGRGGDVLPVREFAQFYFFQDDIRMSSRFTLSLGLRYENYGQAIDKVADLNPGFGPSVSRDDNNFAPRLGFAWSLGGNWVLRGGYGIYYDPTVFNIALITWQGGRVSPFVFDFLPAAFSTLPVPSTNRFPAPPFSLANVNTANASAAVGCDGFPFGLAISATGCTTQDSVSPSLVNPLVQNVSLNLQKQIGRDLLVEFSYVGSKGRSLFQRVDLNPRGGWAFDAVSRQPTLAGCTSFPNGFGVAPCVLPRSDINRSDITQVTNGATSYYHALQVSATHRLTRGRFPLAMTAAYTWSHMTDNASEIFGPGVRFVPGTLRDLFSGTFGFAEAIEAITPFPQDSSNPAKGERGNSSFDRRHRADLSFLALLPSPAPGAARWFFGNWQVNGLFTFQSGQPFSPLNAIGLCRDANGDAQPTNDRPFAGSGPEGTAALLVNCADPSRGYLPAGVATGTPISQATALKNFQFVQAPLNQSRNPNNTATGLVLAGRNILRGPRLVNLDFAIFKNFPWGERRNFQFRMEAYNLFNHPNPGNPLGNVFTANAQPVPAVAFLPGKTPSRVTGVIPENAIDAVNPTTSKSSFLSQQFMNTAARRLQFGVKLIF